MKNLFSYVRIAALAVATFAAGSFLTPSDASAQGRHHGWGGHHGRQHYAPRVHRPHFAPRPHYGHRHYAPRRVYRPVRYVAPYYAAPRCVVRVRWVETAWGPRKIHRRVCY